MRKITLSINHYDDLFVDEIEDGAKLTASHDGGRATVSLTSEQLLALGGEIVSWFTYPGSDVDDLHKKIVDVLSENESRCLDDEVDRGVVASELLKALKSSRALAGLADFAGGASCPKCGASWIGQAGSCSLCGGGGG